MTLNRWKVLACTLTVGVGGLAVFATPPKSPSGDKAEQVKDPAPLPPLTVKPASPVNGAETAPPVIIPVKAEEPAKPMKTDDASKPMKVEELDFVIPVPTLPSTKSLPDLPPIPMPQPATQDKKPADLPVFEPVAPMPPAPLILPAGGEELKVPLVPTEPKKLDAPKVDVPADKPVAPRTPIIDLDVTPTKALPPLPSVPSPKVPDPLPSKPVPPSTPPVSNSPTPPPVTLDPPPPTAFVPLPPSTPPAISETRPEPAKPAPMKANESAKLKLTVRLGDGQPRFEIRNSTTTELLLKVYGEKIEMASSQESNSSVAGVTAIGRVKFTAPGIQGTCEHLTIMSGTGEVLLKGNIRLKTKHGKSWSEMTAEKMVYQIGTTGLSSTARSSITPASYIPD